MDFDSSMSDTNIHMSTVNLIRCAYPVGIPNAHYMTLLSILEKNASIRVLASAIAHIRGGHYSVYMNDVVESKKFTPNKGVLETVFEKLMTCGYKEWLKEEG